LVGHSSGPVHNVGAAEADGRWFHWDRRRMLCHQWKWKSPSDDSILGPGVADDGLPPVHECHGNAKWQQVVNFSNAAEFFVALKGGEPLMLFDEMHVDRAGVFAALAHTADIDMDFLIDVVRKVEPAVSLKSRGEEETMNYIWIGGNNFTSQAHYDLSHNFMVAISGRRVVKLVPPSDVARLPRFPRLHPGNMKVSHGPSSHSCTALYISLVVMYRKHTGVRDNDFTARGE
jgi:hypothetical protein